jgi:hypothetical protein
LNEQPKSAQLESVKNQEKQENSSNETVTTTTNITATVTVSKHLETTKNGPEPCYLKFKHLVSEEIDQTNKSSSLPLPNKYEMLFNFFKGSDTISKLIYNRSEMCTFLKLKMGIQNITKHTFNLVNLGQIKHVFPLAYFYTQEKLFIDFKNDYHLIITPNLQG